MVVFLIVFIFFGSLRVICNFIIINCQTCNNITNYKKSLEKGDIMNNIRH